MILHFYVSKGRTLVLFEKPGPMTSETGNRGGSGFSSRNNDDPTVEATFYFLQQAGVPRKQSILWNVIPWWNETRKVTPQELHAGIASLFELLKLLPRLASVVLVGQKACKALASSQRD